VCVCVCVCVFVCFYSKNKIISAIDWMPDAKGVVAVACCERASLDEQIQMDGKVRYVSVYHVVVYEFVVCAYVADRQKCRLCLTSVCRT